MAEKKRESESQVMSLPPLHIVLGDVSFPDPDGRYKTAEKQQKLDPDMEGIVKRLIAHLKDEK
ncbi:MAG TPA: hypothetical protein VF352_04775 [Anaerolineales bacterium]|jgi:hypothetical protein